MLEQSHVFVLVIASLAVSLMASFTGLSLTYGISGLPGPQRKASVAMAAIALGGGIWSMHFVAMLGLELPVSFYYDALTTLISALVAILVVGIGLLMMHFRVRTPANITVAGAIVGLGIAAMHYLGMSGIQLCRAVYTPLGLTLAWAASVGLGIVSFHVIYGARCRRNVVLGTLCLGLSVFAVHFIAMGGTGFRLDATGVGEGPLLDNATLAMIVTIAAFVICGAFLLTGVTFLPEDAAGSPGAKGDEPELQPATAAASIGAASLRLMEPLPEARAASGGASRGMAPAAADENPAGSLPQQPPANDQPQGPGPSNPPPRHATLVPYEKDGRTIFVDRSSIAALRAEGHYSILYVGGKQLFCPWSISEAEARLADATFIRAHRSYLINVSHVTGFERHKDNGICFFEETLSLGKVTVSRSRLTAVRHALGV